MSSEGKHRIVYGIVGFAALLFLGLIYAWSVFIGPLEADFGWQRSETSFVFTISMIFFCVGNLASGTLTPRTSPRVSILVAAACAAIGFGASSFTSSLPWLFVSYGAFCGFSVGLGANCVLSTALKWFPDRQGLASGALLMGFGMGSMVFSPVVTALLGSIGWQTTFKVLAVVFGIILVLSALVLKNPSAEYSESLMQKARQDNKVSDHEFTTPEMLKTPAFWIFILWVVLVSAGGLALISNAVPAAKDILVVSMDEAAATMMATAAMGTISAFNGLGRLGIGWLWDKKGFRASLFTVSTVFAVSMAVCAFADSSLSFPAIVAGFILLGIGYGGSMSACAAMIGSFFGTKHYSMNYGCATCNLIVASLVGPTISGTLKTATGSYFTSYLILLGFAVVSLVLVALIRKPTAKQQG